MGIGTWAWKDNWMWFGSGQGICDENDLKEAFKVCVKKGIKFFDTAELYGGGESEKVLGKLLAFSGRGIMVGTKFGPVNHRSKKSQLLGALRGSMKRLGRKQVDLYMIHWPDKGKLNEIWIEGLGDAVEKGLARHVGVSNFGIPLMKKAHRMLTVRGIPLACNQVEYSLLNRKIEFNGLLKLCKELHIKVIAYSPLGMGMLSGKYTPSHPPLGRRAKKYGRKYLEQIQPLLRKLEDIGKRRGKTGAQVALNWVICKGALPIPGVKNAVQAKEITGALGWRLSPKEVVVLDIASKELSK